MGDERAGVDAEIVIIGAAQSGNELAWRQLFAWHFDAVYGFCLTLACGRSELAEETAQQAFVVAAQRIGRYDPQQGEFRAWLLGIARNRFLVLQAKERRRRRHETLLPEQGGPGESRTPELCVHEALARLPADYRRALESKYLQRLTMKEMAEAKGISIEAIESLLRRARDRFAQVYQQVQNSV
jgi:RNA polymerase sigma-70 factor (ECF subfamily)